MNSKLDIEITAFENLPITDDSYQHALNQIEVFKANGHICSKILRVLLTKQYEILIHLDEKKIPETLLKQIMALEPYNQKSINLYTNTCNKNSSPYQYIFMIISCHKTLHLATSLANSLDQKSIPNIIIVGGDSQAPYSRNNIICVNAPDNYESLPLKVGAALAYIYENYGELPVFKTDDNNSINDTVKLLSFIQLCLSNNMYAGQASGLQHHDRCWHYNKCEDEKLNSTPYSKPFLNEWASGTFYFLPANAVSSLTISLARFPGLYEGELYEDKLIGDLLFKSKFDLLSLDITDAGLLLDEIHHLID